MFFANLKGFVMQISNRNGITGLRALNKTKGRCDPAGYYARMLTKLVTG